MQNFKNRLLAQLLGDDWKQVKVIEHVKTWWADEHWVIQSTREQWATEVYVNFLIDPVWDAPRNPGQAIKLVTATAFLPQSEEQAVDAIAKISIRQSADSQILPFIFGLNNYRRTQCVDV